MRNHHLLGAGLLLLASSFASAQTTGVSTPGQPLPPARHAESALLIPGMTDSQIIPIHTKIEYTTVIILPPGERILDWLIGDKSRWVLEGVENFAYLRPAEPNIKTNINLVTNLGHVYSFDVDEVSNSHIAPDEKVIVGPPPQPDLSSSSMKPDHPRFVAYADFQKAQLLAQETAKVAQTEIERNRQNSATAMHFDYKYKQGKPFFVSAIYDDGTFTYIQMPPDSSEKPALYVIRDGKPELTNYTYNNGVYVVSGVIQKGYLRAGKGTFNFERKGTK